LPLSWLEYDSWTPGCDAVGQLLADRVVPARSRVKRRTRRSCPFRDDRRHSIGAADPSVSPPGSGIRGEAKGRRITSSRSRRAKCSTRREPSRRIYQRKCSSTRSCIRIRRRDGSALREAPRPLLALQRARGGLCKRRSVSPYLARESPFSSETSAGGWPRPRRRGVNSHGFRNSASRTAISATTRRGPDAARRMPAQVLSHADRREPATRCDPLGKGSRETQIGARAGPRIPLAVDRRDPGPAM